MSYIFHLFFLLLSTRDGLVNSINSREAIHPMNPSYKTATETTQPLFTYALHRGKIDVETGKAYLSKLQ